MASNYLFILVMISMPYFKRRSGLQERRVQKRRWTRISCDLYYWVQEWRAAWLGV